MDPVRFLSVDTAAADQSLVALDDLKDDLGITSSSEDDYLTRQIASASADIALYCDRVFKTETVIETFHLTQTERLLCLERYPVGSIGSITVDGTALASGLYQADGDTGHLYRKDSDGDITTWAICRTVVTYDAGYDTIPADLEAACISLIKARRSARTRDPVLRSEEIPDVYKAAYWVSGPGDGELPPDVTAALDRYRKISL